MLFKITLLVFTAAIPVFSAPVLSTALAWREGSAGAAVVPRHDTFSKEGIHHISRLPVTRRRNAERVMRNAPKRRQNNGGPAGGNIGLSSGAPSGQPGDLSPVGSPGGGFSPVGSPGGGLSRRVMRNAPYRRQQAGGLAEGAVGVLPSSQDGGLTGGDGDADNEGTSTISDLLLGF